MSFDEDLNIDSSLFPINYPFEDIILESFDSPLVILLPLSTSELLKLTI